MQPILSILVCTINDRIKDVPALLLPKRDDVRYIVSFQYTAAMFLDMIPAELQTRNDVRLLPLPTTGLSSNRNNALRHCSTELALLADDDVRYTHRQLDMLISYFQTHPEVDVACFQAVDAQQRPVKPYATHTFEYRNRPKGAYFSSWEIAFRTDAPIPAFDVRFGLGAPFLSCGEEEIFVHHAACLGAHVQYVPQVLCTIPTSETTGSRFSTDTRVRRSKGAVLYMMHGLIGSFLRITKFALLQPTWRHRLRAWKDMLAGVHYLLRHPLNEGVADEIPLDFQPIDFRKIP